MQITFFSVLMAAIWSSSLVVLIYKTRKTQMFLRFFGVSWLVVLYTLSAVRMVLPLEFPYTRVLEVPGIFTQIYQIAKVNLSDRASFHVNLIQVLLVMWVTISAVLLVRLANHYRKARMEIKGYQKKKGIKYKEILRRIHEDTNSKIQVSVLYSPDITIPMGFGLLNKMILLPEREFDEDNLYYILLHEYTHFRNHDLLIKLLVHIYCCVFWWNPLVYLLQKDLSQTLEMKCDYISCLAFNKQQKISYLQAIVNVLKNTDQNNRKFVVSTSLADANGSLEMKERFEFMIQQHGEKRHKVLSVFVMLIFIATFFFLSYSFVIQSSFEAPIYEIETTTNTYEIEEDEIVIREKADETYEYITPYSTQIIDKEFAEELISEGVTLEKEIEE